MYLKCSETIFFSINAPEIWNHRTFHKQIQENKSRSFVFKIYISLSLEHTNCLSSPTLQISQDSTPVSSQKCSQMFCILFSLSILILISCIKYFVTLIYILTCVCVCNSCFPCWKMSKCFVENKLDIKQQSSKGICKVRPSNPLWFAFSWLEQSSPCPWLVFYPESHLLISQGTFSFN